MCKLQDFCATRNLRGIAILAVSEAHNFVFGQISSLNSNGKSSKYNFRPSKMSNGQSLELLESKKLISRIFLRKKYETKLPQILNCGSIIYNCWQFKHENLLLVLINVCLCFVHFFMWLLYAILTQLEALDSDNLWIFALFECWNLAN